ncbi:MAG: permease [Vibrio ordalii]|uniref:permease n=1 Tax=Vibrio ordalii TaxID=28174 RepID=UPI003F312BB8
MSQPSIRPQDSVVAGLINGVINGLIAYWQFKNFDTIPLSVNSIANNEISVWGEAISLTFGLGIILSLITAKLFIKQLNKTRQTEQFNIKSRLFINLLPAAIIQSAILFGWFITLAVIWTKYMGEVFVSNTLAAMLVGGFAFIITLFIEYRTKQNLIFKKVRIFN